MMGGGIERHQRWDSSANLYTIENSVSTSIFSNHLYLQAILAAIFAYLTNGFPKAFTQSFPEGIVKGLPIGFADLCFWFVSGQVTGPACAANPCVLAAADRPPVVENDRSVYKGVP